MHVEPGGVRRTRGAQGHLDFVVVAGGSAGGGEAPVLAEIGVDGEEEAIGLREEEAVRMNGGRDGHGVGEDGDERRRKSVWRGRSTAEEFRVGKIFFKKN